MIHYWQLSALMSFVFLSSCASAKKKEIPVSPPVSSRPLVLAPQGPTPDPLADAYGPLPVKVSSPDQIVLVLGPGFTQGYACAGILKGLKDIKVSIRSIYAGEVCAMVSALYLSQPTVNRMDWALMQIGDAAIGLNENALDKKLKIVFGERQLEELTPPLVIPLMDSETKAIQYVQKGKIREVIRAALAGPGRLTPGKIEGRPFESATNEVPYPFVQARKDEGYPIFVFETEKMNPALVPEMNALNVDSVSVPVRHISDQDFKKRNEAIYFGKRSTLEARKKLFERLGRTE